MNGYSIRYVICSTSLCLYLLICSSKSQFCWATILVLFTCYSLSSLNQLTTGCLVSPLANSVHKHIWSLVFWLWPTWKFTFSRVNVSWDIIFYNVMLMLYWSQSQINYFLVSLLIRRYSIVSHGALTLQKMLHAIQDSFK